MNNCLPICPYYGQCLTEKDCDFCEPVEENNKVKCKFKMKGKCYSLVALRDKLQQNKK